MPSTCHVEQNHRMLEDGKDFWKSSGPAPLLKQNHLEQAAQDHVQTVLKHPQRWRLHNLPGQPVPVLSHAHCKINVSSCSDRTSHDSFCVYCLWSCPSALLERAWLSLLCILRSGVCIHWCDPPWPFPSSGWTVPPLSAFSYMTDVPLV